MHNEIIGKKSCSMPSSASDIQLIHARHYTRAMGFHGIERIDKPFVVKSPYKPSGDQPKSY